MTENTSVMGRKTLLGFGRTALAGLLNAVATAVVARWMGAEILGTIGYLMGLVGLLNIVSDLGFSEAYIRQVAGLDKFARHTGTFALIKLVLAILLSIAILGYPLLDGFGGLQVFLEPTHLLSYYLVGLFYVSSLLSTIFSRTFVARQEAAKLAALSLGGILVSVIAQIVVAWQGWGLTALSVAFALQGMGALVFGLFLFRGYGIDRPSLSLLRSYGAYAWPQMALILVAHLTANVDRTILGWLGGTVQVGYYVGSFGVFNVMNQMLASTMQIFFPRVSRDAELADFESMRKRVKGALKYLLLIVVPIVSMIILLRKPLVLIYLGSSFMPAAQAVAFLASAALPGTITRPYQKILFAINRHRYLLIVNTVGLIVFVVSCLFLVPCSFIGLSAMGWGAAGAACAVLIKETAECICTVFFSARYAAIGVWRGMWWFLLGGGVMVFVGLSLLSLTTDPGLLTYVLAVSSGLASYVLLLTAAGQLRREDLILLWDTVHPLKLLRYIRSEIDRNGTRNVS